MVCNFPRPSNCPEDSLTFRWTKIMSDSDSSGRPLYVGQPQKISYGYTLVATRDVPAGTVVEKFEGPLVQYEECSPYDKQYVLIYYDEPVQDWLLLLPLSNARYANHSCDANCIISSQLELVTARAVRAGEDLTFVYNKGTEHDTWDPIWTFQCCCRSEQCQGLIDRYRPVQDPPLPPDLAQKFLTKAQFERVAMEKATL